MKNFDSRTYSINDFLEWNDKKQLQLSPKFQRKSVWTEDARSYLMDTIICGKPMPKIFIRQTLNVDTRQSIREVVDGQQRLRTIISYLNDGFVISKKHNSKFGGYFFSQLGNVDPDIQSQILNYELAVDLLVNLPDNEILDIFSRLNSYSVILNEQEKIHANHFSRFKIIVDSLAHKFNEFWIENKLLTNQMILRMEDTRLVADLVIAILEGIQSKKQIKSYYSKYEKEFNHDTELIVQKFDKTIYLIKDVFHEGLKNTEFKRIHLFYTLFGSFYHTLYGLHNVDKPIQNIKKEKFEQLRIRLTNLNHLFETKVIAKLSEADIQFLEDSRRATTDTKIRSRRTEYLLDIINSI
ncbi:DUF262 domain-containing protein [Leptospira haakeii]|uniref:GmrSD restriction endonucleases N-terminal domain-containing protein n=1 Tax=Leptospira haakeii TaxID=2023198 RepID=A0ABX4PI43_9LEPT|nr:DUF262 domain-containing protein [Leptospira haakeii]PKA15459.1 hypothetical protein CH363_12650 [Leptospira haakeii]PKA18362.1 hypothetical protein CH377_18070 [Leptospira haakeii]